MPRPIDIPACPGIPAVRSSGRQTREYPIRLVTPLFGGGVDASEPDPTLPIRGTSIRGQLQFWWRATRGASCSTRDALFRRHAEVWGTTEQASPVEVEVRDVQAAAPRPCARYEWNQQARKGQGGWRLSWEVPFRNTALPYALFSFQGQLPPSSSRDAQPEELPAQFIENGSFTLRVRFPEVLRQEVETAIRAWVNLGGLGARTRRGCGSLFCRELVPKDFNDLQQWFRARAVSDSDVVREWPTLPRALLICTEQRPPLEAWDSVIALLRNFRQGVDFARNPGQQQNRPGRSRYPEPETIREIPGSGANRQLSGHQRLPHIPADAFPRAELGLPIVFHFQGRGEPPGRSDLPDLTLYPETGSDGKARERMASPLILKPLALANGQAVSLIMRLLTPRLTGVDLRQGDSSFSLPRTTVVQDGRLATYRDSPLAGAASGSALDAFLALALDPSNGFQEVTR